MDNTAKWFDTYSNHPDVIFDDMDSEDKPSRAMFLRLFDRYSMTVPVKGGFVNWAPRRVFITSNIEPANLYNNDPAVLRRITQILFFNNYPPDATLHLTQLCT